MRKQWQWCLTLCLLLFGGSLFAQEDKAAFDKLKEMEQAAKSLDYEGIFTFQSGKRLQSIRIIHHIDNHGEIERLVSLDGVPREVIRTDNMVTCVYPEGEPVQENHRPLGGGFPIELLQRLVAASPYYSISFGKEKRIADHQSQQLEMKPNDAYRYGYQLWAEKETNLLLQADLIGPADDVLQRFVFSSVNINMPIASELLHLQMHGNKVTWDRQQQKEKRQAISTEPSPWKVMWLPEGFTLRMQQNKVRARNGALIEQRVYSDGLSSLSIFFEKMRAHHQHLRGGMRRGIVNVYGTIQNGYFVTVIGEVPALTVEKIATSIQYGKEASR